MEKLVADEKHTAKKSNGLLAATATFLGGLGAGVAVNVVSDKAPIWWLMALVTIALALQLAVVVRKRPVEAPVISFARNLGIGVTVAGMVLAALESPTLARIGSITVAAGLLTVGLLSQGLEHATRTLTVFSLRFIGVAAVASYLTIGESSVRMFIVIVGTLFLAMALFLAKGSVASMAAVKATFVVLVILCGIAMPNMQGPIGSALLIMGAGVAYWNTDADLRCCSAGLRWLRRSLCSFSSPASRWPLASIHR
jgi:hypothetical protein